MEDIIARFAKDGGRRRLLLHACCAPCSTACLDVLTRYFDVTVLFYNPNITEEDEYAKRLAEEKRLIGLLNEEIRKEREEADAEDRSGLRTEIGILDARYDPASFLAAAKGLESAPEGGERCKKCFTLRLSEAARVARTGEVAGAFGQGAVETEPFDCFTTTLTLSPLKNADLLNEIGEAAAVREGVMFLPSDFKKRDGYLRSIEMSKTYDLYRQDYCGCIYSKAERTCAKCRAC